MSKLWHDVQAVRVQPLELPVGRLKQIGLIMATAVTAALCIQGLILNHESRKLTQSRISLSQAETLLTSGAGPQVMLSAAEALELTSPEAARLAISLTHASLSQQPQQPYAWAELAYYQSRLQGHVDRTALSAFQTSIDQCGYCDQDLLRWRLGFALDHWEDMPEEVRLDVFRGAEFLRWWHMDGAFLAEARERATALGIDFRDYQRKVVSDIRPHEILPAN